MTAALKLEPAPNTEAAGRLAMLAALPVSEEPPTDEELAIFEQMEADMRAGRRGHTTEEIQAVLEQMRRDAGR